MLSIDPKELSERETYKLLIVVSSPGQLLLLHHYQKKTS